MLGKGPRPGRKSVDKEGGTHAIQRQRRTGMMQMHRKEQPRDRTRTSLQHRNVHLSVILVVPQSFGERGFPGLVTKQPAQWVGREGVWKRAYHDASLTGTQR